MCHGSFFNNSELILKNCRIDSFLTTFCNCNFLSHFFISQCWPFFLKMQAQSYEKHVRIARSKLKSQNSDFLTILSLYRNSDKISQNCVTWSGSNVDKKIQIICSLLNSIFFINFFIFMFRFICFLVSVVFWFCILISIDLVMFFIMYLLYSTLVSVSWL